MPSTPEPPKPTAFLAHLGVGGFHRSHQAYVTDVLLERATSRSVPDGYDNARRVSYKQLPGSGGDLNEIADVWGILGVGLMPYLYPASLFSSRVDDDPIWYFLTY